MIGKTIGPYRILERIGAGGMGVVYKAEDARLDRLVALKFLPPYAAGPEESKRFLREAQAASAIDHPNICTVYEVGDDGQGNAYIAMAFYEGEALDQRLARGPLSVDEAVDVARQAAAGLRKAHAQGVVHRDIKPANLMISADGLVKILDFGLAKLATSSKLTKSGAAVGTAGYLAPEQVMAAEVDARCDIWALGVVLYEMLSGERPFKGDYEPAILYSLVHQEPEPLRALRPDVPEHLERIVARCLEKEPANRYQTIDELLEALGAPASAASMVSPPPQAPAPRKSPRALRFAVPLALVAAAAFVFLWMRGERQAAPVTAELQPDAAEAGGEPPAPAVEEPPADPAPPPQAPRPAQAPATDAEPPAVSTAAVAPEDATELQRILDDARDSLARPAPQSIQRAVALYRQAIELDSGSAAAYRGLAEAVFWAGFWGYEAPQRTWPRFTFMTANAVRLDAEGEETQALAATGAALRDHDWAQAGRLFTSAVTGDGSALARGLYALAYLLPQGRDGAAGTQFSPCARPSAGAHGPFHACRRAVRRRPRFLLARLAKPLRAGRDVSAVDARRSALAKEIRAGRQASNDGRRPGAVDRSRGTPRCSRAGADSPRAAGG